MGSRYGLHGEGWIHYALVRFAKARRLKRQERKLHGIRAQIVRVG